jgi:hypothetical protein
MHALNHLLSRVNERYVTRGHEGKAISAPRRGATG